MASTAILQRNERTDIMKKINLSTVLAVAGAVGIFAPDLASVSAWLAGTGIPRLALAAKILGFSAALLASLPRIVTRLRPILAAANLATAPSAIAPVIIGDAPGKVLPIVTDSRYPQKGGALISILAAIGLLATFVWLLGLVCVGGCKTTPTTPDSFFGAVVSCTAQNSHNAQAESAVGSCLVAAIGGDYGACLQGLVVAGYWTVDEVACIVRGYATGAAARLNSETASGTDSAALANANAWLRANRISFR
jgi:hypothetical protein